MTDRRIQRSISVLKQEQRKALARAKGLKIWTWVLLVLGGIRLAFIMTAVISAWIREQRVWLDPLDMVIATGLLAAGIGCLIFRRALLTRMARDERQLERLQQSPTLQAH